MPRRLIWDNESGIGRGKATEPVAVFAGTLATKVVLLPPRDPESKGLVERRNQFFKTSFMPGRHFESPADFNAQFTHWLTTGRAHDQGSSGGPARGGPRSDAGLATGRAASGLA
ncbi:hypothetical protein [Georgenia sp. H159]|uniref:hypothetical protein n=1 Tax=Georgenia sp. H159 TaxID=3076115 RepID=UPI002D76FA27|nr:hypothetical protein [Georgenia sp. H159]